VPINEHIEHLLQSGKSFAVSYADIDNFKPYNDVCGYRKGDELIQFTSNLLGKVCDSAHDFIGHIGGDDFILVMQSPDWEQRCYQALTAFAHTSSILFDQEHRMIGGYQSGDRQGRLVHHSLPTLSIGVTWVSPEFFSSHYEVAEAARAAKNMAKKKPGNSLFIERRRQPLHEVAEVEQVAQTYYG
jgi:diguanylate cyclase (GGDEF)-like protein